MAERVFDVKEGTVEEKARKAIDLLVDFYENTMKVLVSARCLMTRSPLASPSTTSLRTRPGSILSVRDSPRRARLSVRRPTFIPRMSRRSFLRAIKADKRIVAVMDTSSLIVLLTCTFGYWLFCFCRSQTLFEHILQKKQIVTLQKKRFMGLEWDPCQHSLSSPVRRCRVSSCYC